MTASPQSGYSFSLEYVARMAPKLSRVFRRASRISGGCSVGQSNQILGRGAVVLAAEGIESRAGVGEIPTMAGGNRLTLRVGMPLLRRVHSVTLSD